MMPEYYGVQLTDDKARILKRLLDQSNSAQSVEYDGEAPDLTSGTIIVKLIADLASDESVEATQVKLVGDTWTDVRPVTVTNVSASTITATAESPERLIARTIGSKGYCVGSSSGGDSGSCDCGCCGDAEESDITVDTYDTVEFVRFALQDLTYYISTGKQVLPAATYELQVSSGDWVASVTHALLEYDLGNVDVTSTETPTGTLTLDRDNTGDTTLTLVIDAVTVAVWSAPSIYWRRLHAYNLQLETPSNDLITGNCTICILPGRIPECFDCLRDLNGKAPDEITVTVTQPGGWANACTAVFTTHTLEKVESGGSCHWEKSDDPPDINAANCVGPASETPILKLTPSIVSGTQQKLSLEVSYYASSTSPTGAHTAIYEKTWTPSLSDGESACAGSHTLTYVSGGNAAHGFLTTVGVDLG